MVPAETALANPDDDEWKFEKPGTFYDPELEGLTDDAKSWAIVEKGFKQVLDFLRGLGLERHYQPLLSRGVMVGGSFAASTHESLQEAGITSEEEREAILTKRWDFLKQPDVLNFAIRYGDLEDHWDCEEGKVFVKSHIEWPIFKKAKDQIQDALPATFEAQWSIKEEDYALYSSEGRWATASSCDGMIFLWPIDTPSADPPCVRCVQAHFEICTDHVTDWRRMMTVSVGGDNHAVISDLQANRPVSKIKNDTGLTIHEQFLTCDADLDEAKVVIGAVEGQVKVADVQKAKIYQHLKGHEDSVRDIRADFPNNQVVTTSWDRTIKVWDLRAGSAVHTMRGHNSVISRMDVNFDLQLAVSCSHEDRMILWDLRQGRAISSFDNWVANDLCVDWDNMRFASCGDRDIILIWDMEKGVITQEIDPWDSMNAQAIDVDWKRGEILLGTWDNQVLLFDLETGEVNKTLKKALRTMTKVRLKK